MSDSPDAVAGETNDGSAGGGLGLRVSTGRRSHRRRGREQPRLVAEPAQPGILRKHPAAADPMGEDFDYAAEFRTLDLDALARDVDEVLTTSQEWWPADFGHYGPLVIRMVWHCAGTYRIDDGRGGPAAGMQRFAPLNSWPDNRNLDKARRLLWPVKKKYGRTISWADLMIFAGNRALATMGFTTFGFAGGRADVWEPDEDVYWGPEQAWLGDERHSGVRKLENPLAAVQMGLIYVNPEGPNTVPDPLTAARDIRETFRRMGMNDEETVALIAGGHTFGKTHGAADPEKYLGPEPEGAPLEEQGLGWKSSYGTGKGADAITSGLEGTWTPTPTRWDNSFFETLFGYEWDLELSPAGLWQWIPRDGGGAGTVPDAHDPSKTHAPTILTTDLALRLDPVYEPISRRFLENPDQLADAFARVWFKLTHLDMGPIQRYLGPLVPQERLLWQDPVPAVDHELVGRGGHRRAQDARSSPPGCRSPSSSPPRGRRPRRSASATSAAGRTGRASASSRSGAGRSTTPTRWRRCCAPWRGSRSPSTAPGPGARRSRWPTSSCSAGPPPSSRPPGPPATTSRSPSLRDARTPRRSGPMRSPSPRSSRPRTGSATTAGADNRLPSEHLLVDRANLLSLSAPEMTVLVGGLRVLGANSGQSPLGVLTSTPGSLTNDFFVNLLDMGTEWRATSGDGATAETFEGRDRATGEVRWTGSRVDLVFGSNSELRALAEVYASDDAREKFVHDFVAAWDKVMNLDRYDLA